MKKSLLLVCTILVVLLLVGCNEKNTLKCTLHEETIELTFDEGKITKYLINDVEQSTSVIEEANKFLNNIDTNKEAIEKLEKTYTQYGGTCK